MRRPRVLFAVTMTVGLLVAVGWWVAVMYTATPASAATLCVGTESLPHIQDAIDIADDGDTIQIISGTYYETLTITEDITLEGGYSKGCGSRAYPEPQYTTIDGSAVDHVVEITDGSTATLDGLTLTNGQSDKGGGLYVSSAFATLDNVVVTGNATTATTGWTYGAGVYVYGGNVTLTRCEITHNTVESSDGCGGGVAVDGWGTSAIVEWTEIMSNSVAGSGELRGGGIWLDAGSEATFEGTSNLIAHNEATYGGGVYMWGNTDLQGVVIRDNHGSYSGGGIAVSQGFTGGRIANNYILHNTADTYGDSVFTVHASMDIANNTIVGDPSGSGAGIYVSPGGVGGLKLTNNIVTGHTIGILKESGASVTLAGNDVWGNDTDYSGLPAGSGDISVDPDFVDPGTDDYHLDADSLCINAGTMVDGLYFDYDGDRRTGTLLDIGTDELHTEPFFVPLTVKGYGP